VSNINIPIVRSGVFFNKVFLQKLFFCAVIFSAVFYVQVFYGRQSIEGSHLGGATMVFASEDTALPPKEGAGHQSLLDINKASLDELTALPGIGPKLAEAIMRDRETNGLFQNADALLRIKGIGQKKLEKISPFLHFESSAK